MSETLETAIIWAFVRQKRDDLIKRYDPTFFRFPRNQKLFTLIKAGARDVETIKTTAPQVGLRSYELEYLFHTKPVENIDQALQTLEESRAISDVSQICYEIYEKRSELTINELRKRIEKCEEIIKTNSKITPIKSLVEIEDELASFFTDENLTGIELGLERLDVVLSPLFWGRYILIGARPSVGKTALMLQIANELAKRGTKVAIFSLEQSDWQILARLISINAELNFNTALDLLKSDFKGMFKRFPHFENILLDCSPFKSIEEGIERIHAVNIMSGVRIWFVDYLQLIRANFQHAETFTANVSQLFKATIKETKTIGFILSQLNRQSEFRSDYEARLADLRYSGALEQDADVVILLSKIKDDETKRKISIAKNRDGKTLSFTTNYYGEYFKFEMRIPKYDQQEDLLDDILS